MNDNVRGAFFKPTTFALGRIDELFEFTWPTAAALWNLRWQVRGFVDEVPDAGQDALNGRFAAGSGIAGLNLRKACIETTWLEQQEVFAGFILTNAFAVYEYWSDEILTAVGDQVPRVNHPLQTDQPNNGVQAWMTNKLAIRSALNDSQFYPTYQSNSKYSWPMIANLMKSYRYFKQARNSLTHRGGIANALDVQAYDDFAPVSDRVSLGMRGDLEHDPFIMSQRIRLRLRGVVGFCDILIRVMRSIDAELSRSQTAEEITKGRLQLGCGSQSMLSGNIQQRRKQINKICKAGGLPKPNNPDSVYAFMRNNQIIRL